MKLPPDVRAAVESALEVRFGRPPTIVETSAVSGGCISPTARVRTDSGESFFLKWSGSGLPDGLLDAEARGLAEMGATGTVRVPEVVAIAESDGPAWLLLEWLEPGPDTPAAWERLGGMLAALHRTQSDRFGAETSNFIGSLPQENDPSSDWADFWRSRRLEPQLTKALHQGLLGDEDRRRFDRLHAALDGVLAPAGSDGPSLLHGDLWSGNVHMMGSGPAVIDPSSYYGHREVDLAMAELFGGFGEAFRSAYEESWPLAPGYGAARRAIYQLYYLLVHVNLFGRSYVARTRSTLAEAGF